VFDLLLICDVFGVRRSAVSVLAVENAVDGDGVGGFIEEDAVIADARRRSTPSNSPLSGLTRPAPVSA
jgi:hypothetical protein